MIELRFQRSRFAVQSTTQSPLIKNIQAFLKESNIFSNLVDVIFEIFRTAMFNFKPVHCFFFLLYHISHIQKYKIRLKSLE